MVKNRSFTKAVFRAIRGSFSRFLAIFAIVALGVGFLAGLMVTTPDMRHSVGLYYNETRLMDLRVVGNLGLCAEDLAAVAALPGVENAMAAHSVDLEVTTEGGDTLVARLHGVPDGDWGKEDPAFINRLTLVSGRWPENPGEVVIEEQYSSYTELNAGGGVLTLTEEHEDLNRTAFTIVGAVHSGYYLSAVQRGSTSIGNGRLSSIIYLCDSVFTMDYYTDIFAVVSGAAEQTAFSDQYDDFVAPTRDALETLAETQKYVRRDALVDEATEKLDNAQREFDDKSAEGRQELDDALQELQDGEIEYANGLAELEDGEAEYADGVKELADGRAEYNKEIADAEKELADGWTEYNDGVAELADAKKELDDGEIEYLDGEAELLDARKTLDDGKKELDDGLLEIRDGEAQLADGWAQYEKGRDALRGARQQLDAAQAQLDAGPAQLQAELDRLRTAKTQTGAAIAADPTGQTLYGALDALRKELADAGQPVPPALEGTLTQLSAAIAGGAVTPELIGDGAAVYGGLMDAIIAQTEVQGNAALAEAARQLADGRAEYDAGAAELRAARRELQDSDQKLKDARTEWEKGKQEYLDGEAEYADGAKALADARVELDDGWVKYNDGAAELADALIELQDGERQLTDAKVDGARELQNGERDLRKARTELDDGWAELADARTELDDGWAEYNDGLKTFEDEIEEATDKLDEAREKIADIEAPEWYVLTRNENPGYAFYSSDTVKVESIAKVFPIFFFAVAALVASTTMTRMVEEERAHIGTLKALGYGNGKIALKYFVYAGVAGLCGSAFGLALGLRLFPAVINDAYRLMYYLPALRPGDHTFYAALSTALIMAAIFAATYGALRGSLRERTAELLRPKAPPPGKRILLERVGFLWNRMKFTHKVTARNLFRYKKRFLMTVVGIAGCTALLVTGFGLRDSIGDIILLQFGELQTYNLSVSVKNEGDQLNDRRLRVLFEDEERISDYMAVHMETCTGVSGGEETELSIIIPQEDGRLPDFFVFRQRVGHAPVPFSPDGALLTEKAAKTLGLAPGDSLTLRRSDDTEGSVPIAGIVENYVSGYVYLPHELYETAFGEDCEYTTLLCKAADETEAVRDELSTAILSSPKALSVQFTTATIETFSDMLKSIDTIVVVLILSAGMLAFVVLYNLTNINITERQKELATIKVLGFYAPEVSAYVYRETVILSLIGTAVGLCCGVFLHAFVVQTAEVDAVMFGRTIKWASYVYSAALTVAFTLAVNIVMGFKLRRIDMVESLKAPE